MDIQLKIIYCKNKNKKLWIEEDTNVNTDNNKI